MYYLFYGLLKLLSFLPLRVLYLLSDFVYLLLFYVFGYRKDVVMNNLAIAFPEKSEAERRKIMKEFYHNFCDTFIELIKLFSWDEKQIAKHFKCNIEVLNKWVGTGKNVQLISGHFFNWEIANLGLAAKSKMLFVVAYMPLRNTAMDKIIYDLRKKTGSILIAATKFRQQARELLKPPYALILVGDQNPGILSNTYWMDFFTKPAPFVKGPEKGARNDHTVVLFANFYKVKRGYYTCNLELVTENALAYKQGQLTRLLVTKVEDAVRQRPANYLWSHRRWKHEWNEEQYKHQWVDR